MGLALTLSLAACRTQAPHTPQATTSPTPFALNSKQVDDYCHTVNSLTDNNDMFKAKTSLDELVSASGIPQEIFNAHDVYFRDWKSKKTVQLAKERTAIIDACKGPGKWVPN